MNMNLSLRICSILLITAAACEGKIGEIGALPDEGGAEGGGSTGADNGEETGESGTSGQAAPCDTADLDGDEVPDAEDNAPNVYNPDQGDMDGDTIADVVDLCPTLGGDPSNLADSDHDGIGNACDRCGETPLHYNEHASAVPFYMQVRNVPYNDDFDGDGIADGCDNCVKMANCGDLGADNRHVIGDPIPEVDFEVCQTDANNDGIGDACEGAMHPSAAGPVGFGPNDDFDQDGLVNALDGCPRIPVPRTVDCSESPAACPSGSVCTEGVCNHADFDQDGVGDVCDTCPAGPNPNQTEGGEASVDDPDGDFVGSTCEAGLACGAATNPRAHGFYAASAGGSCCVQLLVVDEDTGNLHRAQTCPSADAAPTECALLEGPDLVDPTRRIPVRLGSMCSDADEAAGLCRSLPPGVEAMPGILSPPAGCDEELARVGISVLANTIDPVTSEDVTEPYRFMCLLPQFDDDYDGLGTDCDFCPFAFDPANTPYVDEMGTLWEEDGAYCNGPYLCE
jgi:hypothetical protein